MIFALLKCIFLIGLVLGVARIVFRAGAAVAPALLALAVLAALARLLGRAP